MSSKTLRTPAEAAAPSRQQLVGTAFVFAAITCYSLVPILAKFAYAEGIGTFTLLTIRYAFGLLLLTGTLVVQRRPLGISLRRGTVCFVLGLLIALNAGLAFLAYARIPASTASLLQYIYPVVVVVLNALLGERIGRLRWLLVAIAVLGSWLTVGAAPAGADLVGMLFALGSGVSIAVYLIAAERAARGIAASIVTLLSVAGGAVTLVAYTLLTGQLRFDFQPTAWIFALAIGALAAGTAQSLFLNGAKRMGSSRASLVATAEPIFTVTLSYLLLTERLTPFQAVGATLIIGAIVSQHLLTRRGR